MGKTFAKLIVPFTFSEENEYTVSLSNRLAFIRIKHIRNNDRSETIKRNQNPWKLKNYTR